MTPCFGDLGLLARVGAVPLRLDSVSLQIRAGGLHAAGATARLWHRILGGLPWNGVVGRPLTGAQGPSLIWRASKVWEAGLVSHGIRRPP